MNYYRQCTLEKWVRDTSIVDSIDWSNTWKVAKQTSWIPEQFACINNYIKLKQNSDIWDDGWRITEVGSRLDEESVLANSQDYKRTRKASDI